MGINGIKKGFKALPEDFISNLSSSLIKIIFLL